MAPAVDPKRRCRETGSCYCDNGYTADYFATRHPIIIASVFQCSCTLDTTPLPAAATMRACHAALSLQLSDLIDVYIYLRHLLSTTCLYD